MNETYNTFKWTNCITLLSLCKSSVTEKWFSYWSFTTRQSGKIISRQCGAQTRHTSTESTKFGITVLKAMTPVASSPAEDCVCRFTVLISCIPKRFHFLVPEISEFFKTKILVKGCWFFFPNQMKVIWNTQYNFMKLLFLLIKLSENQMDTNKPCEKQVEK